MRGRPAHTYKECKTTRRLGENDFVLAALGAGVAAPTKPSVIAFGSRTSAWTPQEAPVMSRRPACHATVGPSMACRATTPARVTTSESETLKWACTVPSAARSGRKPWLAPADVSIGHLGHCTTKCVRARVPAQAQAPRMPVTVPPHPIARHALAPARERGDAEGAALVEDQPDSRRREAQVSGEDGGDRARHRGPRD